MKLNEEGLREMLNEVGPEGFYALQYMSQKAWLLYDDEGNLMPIDSGLSLEDIKIVYENEEARAEFIEAIIEGVRTSGIDRNWQGN